MHRALIRQDGHTLVELLVAMVLITVGVLGTMSLIDRASAGTSQTKQREGAVNLARELADTAQGMPFAAVTAGSIQPELKTRGFPDDEPSSSGTWEIKRRGVTYRVEATACSVDDGGDGRGEHPSTAGFCADSAAGTADSTAADYKRVTLRVMPPTGRQVTVTAVVGGTRGASGPGGGGGGGGGGTGGGVDALTITAPALQFGQVTASCWATCTSHTLHASQPTAVSFRATTASSTPMVKWYLDGTHVGTTNGPGTTFNWTWTLPPAQPDGIYQVAAQAFDASGATASGNVRSVDVTLNRFRPDATAFVPALAGRNHLFSNVPEIETYPATNTVRVDRDVAQFEAWRYVPRFSGRAACVGAATVRWCRDTGYSSSSSEIKYALYPYDLDPSGVLRIASTFSGYSRDVMLANARPYQPRNFTATRTGPSTVVLSWTAPVSNTATAAPGGDPDTTTDCVDTFRIYRRDADTTAWSFTDRYDRTAFGNVHSLCGTQGSTSYTDEAAVGAKVYRITAVDTRLSESDWALKPGQSPGVVPSSISVGP